MKTLKGKIGTSFIGVITILTIIGLVSTQIITANLKNSFVKEHSKGLYQGYDDMIQSEVDSAISIINNYYEAYKDGDLTEEEAKARAKNTIKSMKYGKDGYLWIDSKNYDLVAHPLLSKEEGKIGRP